MEEEFRIFTESSEDIGILYYSYRSIKDHIDNLLGKVEGNIKKFLKDPKNYKIDTREDINEFKNKTSKKITPAAIDINNINKIKKTIKKYKSDLDDIITRYAKIRNRVSFGGNYYRAILKRPKVYSKEIDYDAYDAINRNIRNIDRALDWVEKIIIDLSNMVDQDLNILSIVGKVYVKTHIYEDTDQSEKGFSSGHFSEYKESLSTINTPDKKYSMEDIPNTMYFSSPTKVTELKGRVFLTPYIGISSIFTIDRFNVLKDYAKKILVAKQVFLNANIGYDEWGLPNSKLLKPLSLVHMTHNIKDLPGIAKGTSIGYIYTVDISDISKDQLSMFVTMDPNREIIYKGDKPLKIINVQEHTVNWELRFDPENMARHGVGSVKIAESYSSIDELKKEYCIERSDNMDEDDDLEWITEYLMEDVDPPAMPNEGVVAAKEPEKESEKESMPKKADKAESSKNGVRRKKLYIAFIEWCKEYNNKNTFGSIFDKDAFNVSYPFVPEEMRYFYRLANPMLCVLGGELTFFAVAELRKLNAKNSHINEMMIFAATPNDVRVFNNKDKKVYRGTEVNGTLKLNEVLGDTFDIYIQKMINKGDILNAPLEESTEYME